MTPRASSRAARACATVAIALGLSLATSFPVVAAAPAPADAPTPFAAPVDAPANPPVVTPMATSAPAPVTTDVTQAEDIRDIRGPKYIFPLFLAAAILALAALLAIGGYALWRWRHRRRQPRPPLPFEIALQRLQDIRSLLDPKSVREFSIAISDIVRQYIEVALNVTAAHRTTEEFLRDLLDSSNTSLAAHRGLLAEFLNRCDMAKFAGASLSRQIMESLHDSARSFVIATSTPAPAVQTPEGPALITSPAGGA